MRVKRQEDCESRRSSRNKREGYEGGGEGPSILLSGKTVDSGHSWSHFSPPLLFLLSLTNAPIVHSFHTRQHKTRRRTMQTVFCRYRPQLPSSLQILTRAFIACPHWTASASPDGETEWDEAVW